MFPFSCTFRYHPDSSLGGDNVPQDHQQHGTPEVIHSRLAYHSVRGLGVSRASRDYSYSHKG